MALSLYQVSLPQFIRQLKLLDAILGKAEAHATAKAIDHNVFTSARLAPDMLPFNRQIHIATDMVKGCAARLAGIEVPVYEDTETTFPELRARIAKTLAFLQGISPEQVDGSVGRSITVKMRAGEMTLPSDKYLMSFVIPNFYFHVTTAYAILRHLNVDLGKSDFLGSYDTL